MSTTYSTLNPEKISHLTLTVSPIDFDAYKANHKPHEGLMFTMGADADVEKMVAVHGNVPASVLNESFMMASPFILNYGKYADVIDILDDRLALQNFLRMEKWIFDSPDQAGETWRQFLKDCYQENNFFHGRMFVGGRRVDLGQITCSLLTLIADKDTIAPPASSLALASKVGSHDHTTLRFDVGHIGLSTSSKGPRLIWPQIAAWLAARSD